MGDTLADKLRAAPQEVFPQQLLASFPRIAERIAGLWGHREIEAYFQDLMIDERGNRHGFPPEVLMDIFRLRTYHRSLFPPAVRSVDTWADLIDKDVVGQSGDQMGQAFGLHLVAQGAVIARAPEL